MPRGFGLRCSRRRPHPALRSPLIYGRCFVRSIRFDEAT
jgi:hypothetical protein